jgi:hypothetical protein
MKKLQNIIGWHTNKKIIVLESDDWGSFHFKNTYYRDKLLKKYEPNLWMHYHDTFESAADLNHLFEVLNSFKSKKKKTAKVTFLMNPSNPSFEKIKQNNFETFCSEPFLETLNKRKDGKEIFSLYQQAKSSNLLEVGFHGREHLNVQQWMKDLQSNDTFAHLGFENKTWGLSKAYIPGCKKSYRATYDIAEYRELENLKINIKEGIDIMNRTFHQNTSYFLAPNGPYHLSLNSELQKNGINYIGLAKLHNNPLETKWYQKKLFWLGKNTKEGLKVITRNVMFEPGSSRQIDPVNHALSQIQVAFRYGKPAVISSHRANFVGGMDADYRDKNLALLKMLLFEILKKWPEVEFMTSSELGELMQRKK